MKKIISIIISSLLVLSVLVGCSSEAVNSDEVQVWRFAHEENNGSIQDVYVKKFKEVIEEKSNGKVRIEIYPVGQIGDATQQTELLQYGGLEFAMVSPGNTGTIVPENQLFSLHFLFPEDMKKTAELFKTSKALNEMMGQKYLDKNIKVLAYWTEGHMQWTTNKAVNKVENWKGVKMRTMPSPMIVAAYQAYGANPTPVPYMEVYSALQLNMIEGQENPISASEEMKFYEVQKYLTLANSNLYVTTTAVNPDFFNSLSDEYQNLILETIDEIRDFSFDVQDELNGGALDKITAVSDIEVVTLTDEEREAYRAASKSAYQVYKDMVGEEGAVILDTLMKEVEEIESSK